MKNILVVGGIAGVVVGIVDAVCSYIFTVTGVFEPPGGWEIWNVPLISLFILAALSLGVIWGIVFGVIYSRLYGCIPGKGAVKGFYFGLLIWLIKDIAISTYMARLSFEISFAIVSILCGFFMWVALGIVLGVLYKPTK